MCLIFNFKLHFNSEISFPLNDLFLAEYFAGYWRPNNKYISRIKNPVWVGDNSTLENSCTNIKKISISNLNFSKIINKAI